jgi:two-component system, OmpR family, sensor histidine kinase QseC
VSSSNPSLTTILTRRIAFFAALAMLVQLAVVFTDYYWNVGELSRLFVEQETERLAAGIEPAGSDIGFRLPDELKGRYANARTGYLARIRSVTGGSIFESCDTACESHFLPKDINPPDFWLRALRPGKPLTLAGGRAFTIGDQRVLVEVATIGDPQSAISDIIWNEILDHMIVPMSILLVLVLGGTLLSVSNVLRPVAAAAAAADVLDPMDSRSHLPTDHMPREIAHLALAVNRAFERVGELMKSQKVLTSGIAHEVRTPLAAIKLELGRIDHPRARRAEADLDDLVRFVAQLTALARLDTFDHATFEQVDLVALCSDVVEQMAPWVYDNDHSLELRVDVNETTMSAIPALLKDALRNLIENAVRHTPERTAIVVRVQAMTIQVEDIGKLGREWSLEKLHRSDSLGIGLKIVERIASLHKGTLHRRASESGHTFSLNF